MSRLVLVLVLCASQIKTLTSTPETWNDGAAWITRARVVQPIPYFSKVMQQLVDEVERREWCNLKLVDIHKDIDTVVANWNVTGEVTYTNGFVVSIQKIDVHQVSGFVRRYVDENNATVPRATVTGNLLFHDVNLGYDVLANLTDIGVQRYTGEMLIRHIRFNFNIVKDLITQEISVTSTMNSFDSTNVPMIYRPANHVTEVLSRNFTSRDNNNGATSWTPDFISIVTDIVHHKIDYPAICFNNC